VRREAIPLHPGSGKAPVVQLTLDSISVGRWLPEVGMPLVVSYVPDFDRLTVTGLVHEQPQDGVPRFTAKQHVRKPVTVSPPPLDTERVQVTARITVASRNHLVRNRPVQPAKGTPVFLPKPNR